MKIRVLCCSFSFISIFLFLYLQKAVIVTNLLVCFFFFFAIIIIRYEVVTLFSTSCFWPLWRGCLKIYSAMRYFYCQVTWKQGWRKYKLMLLCICLFLRIFFWHCSVVVCCFLFYLENDFSLFALLFLSEDVWPAEGTAL